MPRPRLRGTPATRAVSCTRRPSRPGTDTQRVAASHPSRIPRGTSGRQSFYITTPIYYPSDVPHIGHGYTTVAVDTLARWHRQAGDDTWMLTGTDEHGQKMMRAAAANGATPQQWVDKLVSEAWFPLLERLDVANDDFIRTT